MPSFQGSDWIILQPGDAKVPYDFDFPACTTATANDGTLPYGDSISSYTVSVYDSSDNDVTSEVKYADSRSGTTITVSLDYPTTSGIGYYRLKFVLTLASGAVLELDFRRIRAVDL